MFYSFLASCFIIVILDFSNPNNSIFLRLRVDTNGIICFTFSSLTVKRLLLGICNDFENPVFTTCIEYVLSIKDEANSYRIPIETMVQILRAKKKYVIYVLICNGCREFYIGQTDDKLRDRKTVCPDSYTAQGQFRN